MLCMSLMSLSVRLEHAESLFLLPGATTRSTTVRRWGPRLASNKTKNTSKCLFSFLQGSGIEGKRDKKKNKLPMQKYWTIDFPAQQFLLLVLV